MSRYKAFIETDVLTEAKKRIHHIFDLFDSVAVMFSGGKDSLVVLNLVHEVALERHAARAAAGFPAPEPVIDCVFRDEELIPDEVIDFVDKYRQLPWIRMLWFTVPLASTKYVLGTCHSYIQWDPARGPDRWVRQKPAWGINMEPGDARVFDQWTMDPYVARWFKGKIAFLTGIRAAESLIRYRSCVNKLNENYINAVISPDAKHVNLCKPIFDWSEDDVFRYFYEREIAYCPLYDMQMWAGSQLRVATPMIAESAKKFDKVGRTTPDFYRRVTAIFPEMLLQERYFHDLDRDALQLRYGQTYDGVRLWLDEHLAEDEVQYAKAVKRFEGVMGRALREPDNYPPSYLLTIFMSGHYKREIMPKGNPKP